MLDRNVRRAKFLSHIETQLKQTKKKNLIVVFKSHCDIIERTTKDIQKKKKERNICLYETFKINGFFFSAL